MGVFHPVELAFAPNQFFGRGLELLKLRNLRKKGGAPAIIVACV